MAKNSEQNFSRELSQKMAFKKISFVIYLILTLANNKKFTISKGTKILNKIMNKS